MSKEKFAYCPLIKKDCVGDACKFYVHVTGKHPQSGANLDMEDCAVRWLPTLLLEVSKEVRQGAASMDKVATETSKAGSAVMAGLSQLGMKVKQASDAKQLDAVPEKTIESRTQ
jgi:hypothetical protein